MDQFTNIWKVLEEEIDDFLLVYDKGYELVLYNWPVWKKYNLCRLSFCSPCKGEK